MERAARCLIFAALAGGFASARSSNGVEASVQNTAVSIQIVNPDARTATRVFHDGKVIFEGLPVRSSLGNIPTTPTQAGPFALQAGSRHILWAEAPATSTRAQLEWTPRLDGSAWVVIHYYPGRHDPAVPPFFTFALQGNSYKQR